MYKIIESGTGKAHKVLPKECPECGSKNLVKKKRDIVCSDCGTIIEGEPESGVSL